MVDWLGLAGLSRLWIKTDGFSSLHALMLQTLPPLSRVKHSDYSLAATAELSDWEAASSESEVE